MQIFIPQSLLSVIQQSNSNTSLNCIRTEITKELSQRRKVDVPKDKSQRRKWWVTKIKETFMKLQCGNKRKGEE